MNNRITRISVKLEQDLGKNIKVGDIRTALSFDGGPFFIPYSFHDGANGIVHMEANLSDVKHSIHKITPADIVSQSNGGYCEEETVWSSVFDQLLKEFRWDETTDEYVQLTYQSHGEVQGCINSAFKVVYAKRWLCTDTYVGYGIITFQGTPIAIHSQRGRKYDVNIMFIDRVATDSARLYLESLIDRSTLTFETIRMDADITGYFV